MSLTDILNQLPKLESSELEMICQRVVEIQQRESMEPSLALLQAVNEADASSDEECLDFEEMQKALLSWNTK